MGDVETKEYRSKKRKRNVMAKVLRDDKGPYKMKTVSPKKTEYKRQKLRVGDVITEEDSSE